MNRNTAFRLIALHLVSATEELDYAAVGKLLAARNPELFCEISGIYESDFPETTEDLETPEDNTPTWILSVLQYLKEGDFIAAIKEVRIANDLGLREAKDIIDGFRDSPNRDAAGATRALMSDKNYKILVELRDAYGSDVFP
jgi:hypothetical protein